MKLERLISMIYMLLNNEILSASALAEKYNVSQRTIYRDIDAICAAGIPVVSYQGVNGGYGIMEQYKMDRSLLGSYDVSALITILHSMSTVFEDERAMDTIQRLQTIDRSGSSASRGLSMDIGSWRSHHESLRLLRGAITDQHVISFQYISAKNERIYRKVEPLRLMYKYSVWYVYGFCRTRADYREFRISRMSELSASAEPFQRKHSEEHTQGPHLQERQHHRNETHAWKASSDGIEVVLHVSTQALAKAMDHFYDVQREFCEDGSLRLTFKIDHPDSGWLWSTLLSFGEDIEIIEPASLRTRMQSKLEKMLRLYAKV
ncbi:YafY family transcriptional regulator [Paenibacillus glucanolyticus]|jgi:predicted DNA-binding transcriptional regulator YafY|uniref:Transcriptional regulator n=1 Tax=Paenibacillus glucanolyticus TaxID=59843 RepID=A0A163HJX7_9BACL|nr:MULTISPECIES: YafY family protein [Paenibacillus]ANA79576.1 transcriptional regulator [Paenibacillus glucanolyticus]AVV56474.1 YafY family transcriptional regulator [Paenibacillus glucanolyticus]ETT31254.1 Helix-turn-helix type 11 domain-containing protein [Paenibacillus sp. FSL R5-808]KZS45521.1 transcriptional regulator [Paenibacillus glucanolyticus]OMF77171.1 transcriptional regulator [Paenibacillus glucanolyticus]